MKRGCKISDMLPGIYRRYEIWNGGMKQWRADIVARFRLVFCVTFFTGVWAYGFVITNVLHNYDSIVMTPGGYGTGIASGRWFLTVLGKFIGKYWGNYTLPLFNGMIAVLFITISACIIVAVLDIHSRVFSCIIGMLFISFPTLASSMLFMYTVHYYAFAVFLTVLGVYFGCSKIRGGYYYSVNMLCPVTGNLPGVYSAGNIALFIGFNTERIFRIGSFRYSLF